MSKIILAEQASAPSTPSAGKVAVYANNATLPALCWKDDAGNVNVAPATVSGTWTPVLAFNGVSTGITYTTQSGQYIRVGNIMTVAFDLLLSSKGSFSAGDAATITGLPAAPAGSIMYGGVAHYVSGFSSVVSAPSGYITSTTIALLFFNSGLSVLTYANFGNTSRLAMTITYRTA